jgi:ABC-2 type transport system permease protein
MVVSLFRYTFKTNWPLIAIFTLIITGYLVLVISMYDIEIIKNLETVIKMYPPELMASVGMDNIPTSLTDFLASYIYDFLVQLLLLVYTIVLPLRLIVRFVDRGSMTFLLSTPYSRYQIAGTQALYMILSLVIMFSLVAVSGIQCEMLSLQVLLFYRPFLSFH